MPGVYGLRSFDDAVRLKEAVASAVAARRPPGGRRTASSSEPRSPGVKVAEVLRAAGMEVCIVEKEACVLPLAAHPDCACAIQQHLSDQGYELRLGVSLAGVELADGRLLARFGVNAGRRRTPSSVRELGDGHGRGLHRLAAQHRFRRSGTRWPPDVGLIVDEHMQTSAPGLYAAGDVAQALNPLSGAHEVVALWPNARRQGRVAGLNMAGVHAEYPGNLPYNITHVGDLLFASAGSMREPEALDVDTSGGRRHGVLVQGRAPGRLQHGRQRGGRGATAARAGAR